MSNTALVGSLTPDGTVSTDAAGPVWPKVRAGVRALAAVEPGDVAGYLAVLADRTALGLFLGQDSPAMPIARHIQLVATWGFLFFGISLVLFGTVRANGEVVWPLIILFVAMYPVRLGVALGLRGWLGVDALWLSFPIGMVATAIMAAGLYLQGGWKRRVLAPADCPGGMECREPAVAVRGPGGGPRVCRP